MDSSILQFQCRDCAEYFPRTSEFFNKDRAKPDGLRYYCRQCHVKKSGRWQSNNRPRINANKRRYRKMSNPEYAEKQTAYLEASQERRREYAKRHRAENYDRIRARERAYYWENREKRLEKGKAWRSANLLKCRARSKAYYLANREKCLEASATYRLSNKGKFRSYSAKYYLRHKQKILAKQLLVTQANPEVVRERARASYRRRQRINPGKFKAICARRRARLLSAQGIYTEQDVKKQLRAQGGKCWWCGKTLQEFEVDHVYPLSKGGSNGPENIVCSCQTCNRSKGAKLPLEFAGRLF